MSRSKKSPTTRRKNKPARFVDQLIGYAVTFMGGLHQDRFIHIAAWKAEGKSARFDDVMYRTEFWAYDPAFLTEKQRKTLKIVAWKKIQVPLRITDRG